MTGDFALSFSDGSSTGRTSCLSYGASAIDVENALENLAEIGVDITVERCGDASFAWNYGYVYEITFTELPHNAAQINILQDTPCSGLSVSVGR